MMLKCTWEQICKHLLEKLIRSKVHRNKMPSIHWSFPLSRLIYELEYNILSISAFMSLYLLLHLCSFLLVLLFQLYVLWCFLFPVLPSAFTPEASSCPSRPKPATVTGLLECRKRDENKLIKNLITGETDPCLPYSSSSAVLFFNHWGGIGSSKMKSIYQMV